MSHAPATGLAVGSSILEPILKPCLSPFRLGEALYSSAELTLAGSFAERESVL